MFPENRNRRLRKNSAIRAMVQENRLHPSDFIVPLFFMEGENKKGRNSLYAWLFSLHTRLTCHRS